MAPPPADTSIIQTLAFFDIFSHPLTEQELYRLQWRLGGGMQKEDVRRGLDELLSGGRIVRDSGFYSFPGRDADARLRNRRLKLAEKKMRIALRAARLARFVPFVRALFVCNTVALGVPRKDSDVDVFIVLRRGRVWLSRLLLTALLSVCGLRRHGDSVSNKICLSFYISDSSLGIERVAEDRPDIYLIYWLAHLVPVYDPDSLHARIMRENMWACEFAPCALVPFSPHSRHSVSDTRFSRALRRVQEYALSGAAGDSAENAARRFQRWHMGRNSASVQNAPDTRVVIDDTMLKFHENDRRTLYRGMWRARCEQRGV